MAPTSGIPSNSIIETITSDDQRDEINAKLWSMMKKSVLNTTIQSR